MNLISLPKELNPTVFTPTTSPTEYPLPPLETVAATATPLVMVIFNVPFLPLPV